MLVENQRVPTTTATQHCLLHSCSETYINHNGANKGSVRELVSESPPTNNTSVMHSYLWNKTTKFFDSIGFYCAFCGAPSDKYNVICLRYAKTFKLERKTKNASASRFKGKALNLILNFLVLLLCVFLQIIGLVAIRYNLKIEKRCRHYVAKLHRTKGQKGGTERPGQKGRDRTSRICPRRVGTFCPSPSVPALLSQPFCPRTKRLGLGQKGILVPGVLSHLSVPGQKGISLFSYPLSNGHRLGDTSWLIRPGWFRQWRNLCVQQKIRTSVRCC